MQVPNLPSHRDLFFYKKTKETKQTKKTIVSQTPSELNGSVLQQNQPNE
jgi:hypothetical protein